ncbi:guanylate kinase [Streptomyces venezuelae]|uniref:guanylate kinase n=1 Tax=Streptomyces venezuelae TaxID=54571 RepID=UPI00278BC435|nr:guanylate kinase [Streptomyces venezuelae]
MTGPRGVVLFGPPAAGKDTVSAALNVLDARFAQLVKVKVGSGRTAGYRMATEEELGSLRTAGRIVLETERYGNTYAVDRADLDEMRAAGGFPVVHVGSLAHLRSFLRAVGEPWLRVLLWLPREECALRSEGRGDRDTEERLGVWDATLEDLAAADPDEPLFHLLLRTDLRSPEETAAVVAEAVAAGAERPRSGKELVAFLREQAAHGH